MNKDLIDNIDSIEVEDVQAGCSDTGSVTGHTLILQYTLTLHILFICNYLQERVTRAVGRVALCNYTHTHPLQ